MIECKGCRALEFISDGVKRGTVMNLKLSDVRYNCALNNKITLVNEQPYCENCTEKTTRVKRKR